MADGLPLACTVEEVYNKDVFIVRQDAPPPTYWWHGIYGACGLPIYQRSLACGTLEKLYLKQILDTSSILYDDQTP